jgi:hypothetical protein
MAENLYKLAIYFGNTRYEEVATSMLQHIIPDVDYPSAFTNWLYTFMNYSDANKELAICGSDALTYAKRINSMYLPQIILAGTDKQSSLPFLSDRFVEGKTLFYVCKNKTCDLPSDNFDDVLKTINQ